MNEKAKNMVKILKMDVPQIEPPTNCGWRGAMN
jgi:ArsR family metal-binding transcriptional regulator